MGTLSENLTAFASNFLGDKEAYGKAEKINPSWKRLVEDIPKELKTQAKLTSDFIIEGSIGAGNIAEIPWVGVFDKDITETAQTGYYIVFLFKSNMSGFYLSLNQGWTQYKDRYDDLKEAKLEIKKSAEKAQTILRTTLDFDIGPIELGAMGDLGKGYELGNICSVYYAIDSVIDDDDIVNSLRSLMAVYRELKGLVGTDIFNIKSVASEEDYQEQAQSTDGKSIPEGPIKKPENSLSRSNASWSRDPGIAKVALEKAGYLCLVDTSHTTFTSKANGKQFVEAHHLVPMEHQGKFDYSLDVPENIVALCPICHRKIHLATAEEMINMLKMLIEERKEGLEHRGIEISYRQLEDFYCKVNSR
jgi:5-methylcytosine-specific restriction protein A